jgi:hypothetical protein
MSEKSWHVVHCTRLQNTQTKGLALNRLRAFCG